ncbi:E3 ubiquitin-protein ligase MARCH5 [Holothuria leucospilota]|uniref:E3 ubiquitin-protein ligase MARCHF5 n=1 Tax=Holothuria leucospilota TaxID=206669 RepID=A0A9Q0YN39_HOLLE|nr:E3 ubiquitin-protein ligase MARCH5 [Holothuria leucospilota]
MSTTAAEVRRRHESAERRSCWVCFATDEDDPTAAWVRPCRCRGTTKWVHQSCLQRWVDEKQRGNSTAKVSCPQCGTEYDIRYPQLGFTVLVLDSIDRVINKVCPFVAGGMIIGSLYWTAVTYGAVTVMQLLGHKEGLDVMERADPLFLLIGLPTIPLVLILGKMIRWEDYVLRFWRKYSPSLWKLVSSNDSKLQMPPRVPLDRPGYTDPTSATRVLCGAMIFPTIATITGKLLFSSINSNMQRTVLGGIVFVAVKGVMNIYYKQQQFNRQSYRTIGDFEERPSTATSTASTNSSAADSSSSVRE